MPKCPTCNKEASFDYKYDFGDVPATLRGVPMYCRKCYTALIATIKSRLSLMLGFILFMILGAITCRILLFNTSLGARIKWLRLFVVPLFTLFILYLWPYIWWKNFAKLKKVGQVSPYNFKEE